MIEPDNTRALEHAMYDALVAGAWQVKVAKLVILASKRDEVPDDAIVKAALDRLVQRDDIQSFGNIRRWRHSEVRRLLPSAG